MSKRKTSGWRIFGIITVSLVVIGSYGLALALLGMTLVRPVWIVGPSFLFAVLTAFVFRQKWKWLTGTDNIAINAICHTIAAAGLFMAVILGANYLGRNTSESEAVRGEIIKVFSETRYRSKRVARNRYTRGEPYQVYFMIVRLPDGRECKRPISLQRYNRYVRSNRLRRERPDSVDLHLTPGALGMTIIERDSGK